MQSERNLVYTHGNADSAIISFTLPIYFSFYRRETKYQTRWMSGNVYNLKMIGFYDGWLKNYCK